MKKCINCGIELNDNALFCGACGTKQAEQKKFCTNCGTELQPEAKFCMACGTPVANAAPAGGSEALSADKAAAEKYINEGGLITYTDAEEIERIFPLVAGSDYLKFKEAEKEVLEYAKNLVKSGKLEWRRYGEPGRPVSKDNEPDDEYVGDIKYDIVDDTLILLGQGVMPRIPSWSDQINQEENYWALNEDIKDKRDKITKVVILGNITSIGPRCFENFWTLKTVVMPQSIESIRTNAFWNCNELEYVTLPKNLELIKTGAFQSTNLKCLFIPENVEDIEETAFKGNKQLCIAFVHEDCCIDKHAFENCDIINM